MIQKLLKKFVLFTAIKLITLRYGVFTDQLSKLKLITDPDIYYLFCMIDTRYVLDEDTYSEIFEKFSVDYPRMTRELFIAQDILISLDSCFL